MSRTRDRPWSIALAIIIIIALTMVFALALAVSAQRGRGGGGGARLGPGGGGARMAPRGGGFRAPSGGSFRGPSVSPKMAPRGGSFSGQFSRPTGQIPSSRVAPRGGSYGGQFSRPTGQIPSYRTAPRGGSFGGQFSRPTGQIPSQRVAPRYTPPASGRMQATPQRGQTVSPQQRVRPGTQPGVGAGPRMQPGAGQGTRVGPGGQQRRQSQPGVTPGTTSPDGRTGPRIDGRRGTTTRGPERVGPGRVTDTDRRGPGRIQTDRRGPGSAVREGRDGREGTWRGRDGRGGREGYGRVPRHDGDGRYRHRPPRHYDGRYYYDYGPFLGLSFFFGGWGFGLGYPYGYYSPFYDYGFPYVYSPRTVYIQQPVYTYTPIPVYETYYLEQPRPSGLSQTIDDIRNAWLTGNDDLIRRHVDANGNVAVYLNGVYSYSIPGTDYWNMVRDAMSRTRTIKFVTTGLELRSDGAYELTGRHDFYDANNNVKSTEISYTLSPVGNAWIITGVGSIGPAELQ